MIWSYLQPHAGRRAVPSQLLLQAQELSTSKLHVVSPAANCYQHHDNSDTCFCLAVTYSCWIVVVFSLLGWKPWVFTLMLFMRLIILRANHLLILSLTSWRDWASWGSPDAKGFPAPYSFSCFSFDTSLDLFHQVWRVSESSVALQQGRCPTPGLHRGRVHPLCCACCWLRFPSPRLYCISEWEVASFSVTDDENLFLRVIFPNMKTRHGGVELQQASLSARLPLLLLNTSAPCRANPANIS